MNQRVLSDVVNSFMTAVPIIYYYYCYYYFFYSYQRKVFCKSYRNQKPKILSYRNQSIDLQSISVEWFLYDRDLRHERVNYSIFNNCGNTHNKSKFCNMRNISNQYLGEKIGDTDIMSVMSVMIMRVFSGI